MHRTIALMGLAMTMSGGCATILRGTHQTLGIDTDPTGAAVQVDGKTFASPARVDVRRKDDHNVVISKEGFRTIEFTMTPQWDGLSLIGNIILPGGSIGLVTDTVNGSDVAFFQLATIKMVPASQPSDEPLKLNDFKGHLLTTDQYAEAVKADRSDRSQFFRGEP